MERTMLYRPLTPSETLQLEQNGCFADNWQWVTVKDGFEPSHIRHTTFRGKVQLGCFKHGTGISMAMLHCCTIEDNVTIRQVGLLQNYIVRSNAKIECCGNISTGDHPIFGNGITVEPINEGGGREVLLYNGITAQTAYLMAMMQHRPKFIKAIQLLIAEEVKANGSDVGIIGHHTTITSTTTISNVMVGDHAVIAGASHLSNGTVLSSSVSPTYIGHGVMAYDFIVACGAKVDNGAIIKKCFVGEGSAVDRQFSAENSLFFANSQMYHGEACSVFAAPYSVSHHKSTLLIATYCGFLNVGSGSNQSNHMYKLGPLHQGILERGCKLGSDSYMLWPGKIGPFTFITGRHYSNPDIGDFPFSYLLDDAGISQLVPGANLRSIGTLRDAAKWPKRDLRKGPKTDLIDFGLFNAYTIQTVLKGRDALIRLEQMQKAENGYYTIGDVRVKKPALKRGIDVYNEAMLLFVGQQLIDRLVADVSLPLSTTLEELDLQDDWVDLAGMIMNHQHLAELTVDVENGTISDIGKLHKRLAETHALTNNYQWHWLMMKSEQLIGLDLRTANTSELKTLIEKWETGSTFFYQMLLKDAQKEFSERSKTGFGIMADKDVRSADFENVRGTFDNNPFVKELNEQMTQNKLKAKQAIESLMH